MRRCQEVCPVNIPLPKLIRALRAKSWQQRYEPISNRLVIKLFSQLASRPRLFQWSLSISVNLMHWQGLQTDADIEPEDTLGLCWADYRVAETGSYVIHSGEDSPILLHFLPRYLLVVLPASKILAYLDDYALIADGAAKNTAIPRNSCIISGASGTTDIEGVLVRGAHSP
jgi:L-lactate utilization protein LutC